MKRINLKEEILHVIHTNCYTEEDNPCDSVIMGEDFYKLADDLLALYKEYSDINKGI